LTASLSTPERERLGSWLAPRWWPRAFFGVYWLVGSLVFVARGEGAPSVAAVSIILLLAVAAVAAELVKFGAMTADERFGWWVRTALLSDPAPVGLDEATLVRASADRVARAYERASGSRAPAPGTDVKAWARALLIRHVTGTSVHDRPWGRRAPSVALSIHWDRVGTALTVLAAVASAVVGIIALTK
jgi:hypothetical protein